MTIKHKNNLIKKIMTLILPSIYNFTDKLQKLKETNLVHQYIFPYNYDKMLNIIKNIQTFGNLLNFIEGKIISDPILLKGQSNFAKNTYFFLRYKSLISLYMKVVDIIETEYFFKIHYKVYKTSPKLLDFSLIFNLHNISDSSSYFTMIFNFPKIDLNPFFVNICKHAQIYYMNILNKDISKNKLFTFYNNMKVINIYFDFISSLCLHYNLFKLFFPSTKTLKNLTSEENNGILYENQRFKLTLKEKKTFERLPHNMQINVNSIQNLKSQLLIIYHMEKYDEWYEYPHHAIYFFLKRISPNKTFCSMKTLFDFPVSEEFFGSIGNYAQRLIHNLEKVCMDYKERREKNFHENMV